MEVSLKFHHRFNGPVSVFQAAKDIQISNNPLLQNIWKTCINLLEAWVQKLKIKTVLYNIDAYAAVMIEEERLVKEVEVMKEIDIYKKLNPNVIVYKTEQPYTYIVEHPSDGSNAQNKLGGTIEIFNPHTPRARGDS